MWVFPDWAGSINCFKTSATVDEEPGSVTASDVALELESCVSIGRIDTVTVGVPLLETFTLRTAPLPPSTSLMLTVLVMGMLPTDAFVLPPEPLLFVASGISV